MVGAALVLAALDPMGSAGRSGGLRAATARAPLRVSLAGGGTDVPPLAPGVGGRVVSVALGWSVEARVEPIEAGWVELRAPGAELRRAASEPPSRLAPLRLLEAALAEAGVASGVRLTVASDVAAGSGLGGSGAAAVACLAALGAATGAPREGLALARAALALERDRLGLACGAQDPVVAALGGAVAIRVDEGGFDAGRLAVGEATWAALERGLWLVDSEVRRVSGEVIERAGPIEAADARALVASAERAAGALEAGDVGGLTEAIRASADVKTRLLARRGDPTAQLAQALERAGAAVARVCGAGEGGYVLAWDPEGRASLGGAAVRPGLWR